LNTDQYDIVVVGGGPAGSMAAKSAASRDVRTLLLERDSAFGVPVRCAEGVSTKFIGKYVDIEPRFIARKIESIALYSPDDTGVTVDNTGELGVVLERAIFDRHLAELAAEAGAHVQTKSDVTGLIIEKGKIKGVRYSQLGKEHEVRCKMVIGADGVESRIGRWAGIKSEAKPMDLESAYQKTLANIDYDSRKIHIYLGNSLAPGGYAWIFPKGERTANVGIGVKTLMGNPGEAKRNLDEFIKKHFGNPSVVSETAGGIPCGTPLKEPFADGVILVGDAARHCNPLTGGGIYTAIVSGHYGGDVAADAIERGDVSANFLKIFNKKIYKDIIVVHNRAYRIAKAVANLSDESLNQTAHELSKNNGEKLSMRKIFIHGLARYPKLSMDIMKAFLTS